MKKSLFLVMIVMVLMSLLTSAVFAANQGASGAVAGNGSKVALISGAYTLVGAQITYNSITYTSNQIFLLGDAANTWTAYAQTLTITAVPVCTNGANTGYFNIGNVGVAPNGSGVGLWSGTKFTNGVILDAGPVGVTVSVSVSGK